jgi:hypothetical protein
MAPVFRSLGGVETCGGGDFATVTGAVPARSQESLSQVEFHSGEISPRQFAKPSQPAPVFQIAAAAARLPAAAVY